MLVEPVVRPSDFVYTKFVTTVVVIVPASSIEDFKAGYAYWTKNVVPESAKRLGVPEKDGLTLW